MSALVPRSAPPHRHNAQGGREYGLPITISHVHSNTPAARVDAFKPGDIILTVNFIDLTDFDHDSAVNLLKNLVSSTVHSRAFAIECAHCLLHTITFTVWKHSFWRDLF